MNNTKMTIGSLFSGIGGFDLGFQRAGFEITWQVEIDNYCKRVLKKNFPEVPCHHDIRHIDWDSVPRVDLVCGGFPCQPFSIAGKRQGKADDRYLWPEVVRCLEIIRPTWFVGENVPGIINLALDKVCTDLESLDYAVWPVCLPACAVDAPHIRQRIWILAHAKREGLQRQRSEHELRKDCSKVEAGRRSGWIAEPTIQRVAHGIPNRVDRLRGLGNAVVPQIAEEIGKMILHVHNEPHTVRGSMYDDAR